MLKGLLDIAEQAMDSEESEEITINAEDNDAVVKTIIKTQWLGPLDVTKSNSDYWRKMADYWRLAPDQAKRQLCANCEYFDNTPEALEAMEAVPENAFDKDAGGRGYCHKFEFICHNLRTCKSWEKKEYEDD